MRTMAPYIHKTPLCFPPGKRGWEVEKEGKGRGKKSKKQPTTMQGKHNPRLQASLKVLLEFFLQRLVLLWVRGGLRGVWTGG